jgi:hypothetical protein
MGRRRQRGVLAAICIGAAAAGMLVSSRALAQTESQGRMRPFIAEIIEKHFDQNGSLAPLPGGIVYITIGRKSNGSQVRFFPIQDADGCFTLPRDIFDVSGKQVKVFPDTKSVSTYYIDSGSVADHIANFESCPPEAEDPDAPRSSRLGYEVVEITTRTITRRGKEKDDRWVAPALNCFALADTNTGVFGSRNESEVINIFEGEPLTRGSPCRRTIRSARLPSLRRPSPRDFRGHTFMPAWGAAMGDRSYSLHRIPRQ